MDANGGQWIEGSFTQGRMGFASADPEVEEFIDFMSIKHSGEFPIPLFISTCSGPFRGSGDNVSHCCGYYLGGTVTFNYPMAYRYNRYLTGWICLAYTWIKRRSISS